MNQDVDLDPTAVSGRNLRGLARNAALLIVAAGFERRARALTTVLGDVLPRDVVIVAYTTDIRENEISRARIGGMASARGARIDEIMFDPGAPEAFSEQLAGRIAALLPDLQGEVWLDVSALTMQGICGALAAIREVAPLVRTRVFYTEAEEYFPTQEEFAAKRPANPLSKEMNALSKEMAGNLIMKRFGGSIFDPSTCLVVFVGYEAHRAFGVVDQINPSKLVVVYGRPGREDLEWRLDMSKELHQTLDAARPTAAEEVSTLRISESLRLLEKYYDFLFDNHNFRPPDIAS